MKTISLTKAAVAAALLSFSAMTATADTFENKNNDVLAVAKHKGNFTTFAKAVEAAGLQDTLTAQGPVTIFAPTDDAFNNLFTENNITEARFLQIPELDKLLQLHVIPGRLLEADLANGQQETTLEGSNVTFTVTADGVKINDSFITQPDVSASNGVIQAINAVMLPAR